MAEDVQVTLDVPLGPNANCNPPFFYCWLPLAEADAIVIQKDDWTLELRFSSEDPEKDQQYANASINAVQALVTLKNLSDELIQGILEPPDYSHVDDISVLQNNIHIRLAEDVVRFVGERVNRFISYARNHLGQYFLEENPPLHYNVTSNLLKLNGRIRVGQGEWKRWRPPGGIIGYTVKGYRGDRKRLIHKVDWPAVQDFVASDRKVGLVRELLTGAEAFAEAEHRRAALTEAVTALEVAIHRFARKPSNDALGKRVADRMHLGALHNQVTHMGLSGTVRFLLPLVLPDDKVPTTLLRLCSEAIAERQTVVHGGQRDIDRTKVQSYLDAIRKLCLLLEEMSAEDSD